MPVSNLPLKKSAEWATSLTCIHSALTFVVLGLNPGFVNMRDGVLKAC